MSNKLFYCFSNKGDDLVTLLDDIQKLFDSTVTIKLFYNPDELITDLETSGNKYPDILIIDVESISADAVQYIKNARLLSTKMGILVIGKIEDLVFVQQQFHNQSGLHYLVKPLTYEELKLAINITLSISSLLKKHTNCEMHNYNIEERVNESLQKLIDANMAKDQFLSIIAHDLKSPFHSLLGATDILLNNWENIPEKHKIEFITDIRKTASDTHKLLSNLLDWTKIQKEKLRVTITEVNVKELVDLALHTSHNYANLKGIRVKNEICDCLKVQTDENMIATVFRNLISNAVQYTQPGGNIKISAIETNDGCTFCVADNGSGIEKAHIRDYFEKGNTKKLEGDTNVFKGLGLLICKDFVEKTGGEIWLETEKGQGSKFYFTVPA